MSALTFSHWSAAYVGKPHSRTGEGPDAFSCWGLVRAVVRERCGLALPRVALNEQERLEPAALASLKEAARAGGWGRVQFSGRARPHDGDIVLMTSPVESHVGVVVSAARRVCVLHSVRGAGVVLEDWREAVLGVVPELWRRGE